LWPLHQIVEVNVAACETAPIFERYLEVHVARQCSTARADQDASKKERAPFDANVVVLVRVAGSVAE
jgi:hypothetical protein